MKKQNPIFKKFFLAAGIFLSFPFFSLAKERTVVTDWYIRNFESEIVVNTDSSLTITEKITADCGNLPGKHGIFRVLPTQINTTDQGVIKTPVKLLGITDFNGKKHKYSQSKDFSNSTVTWKIGDPDKTVIGENYYKISYRVENVVRTENENFDELYWNLNGNFWELEIDEFSARIIFASGVDKNKAQVDYWTGTLGLKNKDFAEWRWTDENVLEFKSRKMLFPREGITTSVTFPKNIISPYRTPLWEKYAWALAAMFPLLAFLIAFYFWKKYGDDPEMKKTVIAEYSIPENLTPMELGTLKNNGSLKPEFITATIVNFAVKGIISIEEVKKDGIIGFLSGQDFEFTLIKKDAPFSDSEKMVLELVFGRGLPVSGASLSAIKKKMPSETNFLKNLEEKVIDELFEKKLIEKTGLTFRIIFLILGIIVIIFPFFLFNFLGPYFSVGFFVSGIIFLIFSFFMPKRTARGTGVAWKIKGFELYMRTAEKHRQQFYEKENIFEKFLPYAMVFGMTKLWIKKMEEIYGQDYFTFYHPVWYVGADLASFDVSSFESQLSGITSAINSVSSSSSGSGGGGFSGGGGGGGGGGGW